MKVLWCASFSLLAISPEIRLELLELSHTNLLKDMKALNSRTSKLQKLDARTRRKAVNWKEFLKNHVDYVSLYTYENESISGGPLTTLVSKVGPLRKSYMEQMIVRHPQLLLNILSSDMARIRDRSSQISQDLNMNSSQKQILNNISGISSYRGNIRSIITYLRNRIHMDQTSIAATIFKTPKILNYSIHKISSSVEFFLSEGFTAQDVEKMIMLRPMVLAYSTSSKLEPIIKFFKVDLGISNYHRVVARYPQVFSVRVDGLTKRAQFLQSNMELLGSSTRSEWLDVSFVISGFPPVLWLSENNLLEKVQYLQHEFDFNSEELRNIFVSYPQVLGLGIEQNLMVKMDYFLLSSNCGGAGLTKYELKELILYQPALLAYSLEGRIKPRIELMKEHFISFSYCPPYLMSYSNIKFEKW